MSSKRPARIHPSTDRSRFRVPQPDIRQGSGNPAEEREAGPGGPKGSGTPQEPVYRIN